MKKIIKTVIGVLAVIFALSFAAGCSDSKYSQKTPDGAAKAYAELRYTYDYNYADYCCFKTELTKTLIDTSMQENIILEKEYYTTVEVSSVTYTKNADLTEEEYNSLSMEKAVTITAAESGTLVYHLKMVCNVEGKEQNLPECDRDYTEQITCLQVGGLWYVYIAVH